MSEASEMGDRVDAGKRVLPLGCGEVAQRDTVAGAVLFGRKPTNRSNVSNATFGEAPGQRSTNEAICTCNQYFSRAIHANFQPCLLKKRTALRRK
jgi:hypothetical protein